MKLWKKWVAGSAAFLLVLAGFIALILPGIVRSQAVKQIQAATGRKFSVGKVSLNPFTWTAEVRDVRLTEKDGRATFVSFSSVRATVSPASIWRAAPVLSKTRVTAPYIHLVRTAANTYNFSDLMESKGPKKEKTEKPARFSLNNIVISNGSVTFSIVPFLRRKVIRSGALSSVSRSSATSPTWRTNMSSPVLAQS